SIFHTAKESGVGVFRLFALLLADDLLAGGLVDDLHRQAHLAALVEAHQLDPDLVAFLDDVGGLADAVGGELGDVDEAVLGTEEVDEGAEIGGLHHGALIDLADFRLGDDGVNPLLRRLDLLGVGRGDLDRAVVLDVDLGAGLLDDLADDLAAGADHVADLVGRDVHHLDARRELAELGAAFGDRLGHLAEDVQAAAPGLVEGDLHDLLGDAVDLDVHLQGGDAFRGSGDLEVHVAQMVLVAQNVAEHCEALILFDQAHGNAGYGLLQRYAGIHQRQRGAADGGHGGRTVGFGDLGDH